MCEPWREKVITTIDRIECWGATPTSRSLKLREAPYYEIEIEIKKPPNLKQMGGLLYKPIKIITSVLSSKRLQIKCIASA